VSADSGPMRVETTRTIRHGRERWQFTVRDDDGIFQQSAFRYSSERNARQAGQAVIADHS
jgi:hypothetical protein